MTKQDKRITVSANKGSHCASDRKPNWFFGGWLRFMQEKGDKSNHVQAGIISSDSTKPTKVLQYHNWHLQKNCISTIKQNPLLKWVSLNHTTTKRKTIYCQPSTATQIIKGCQFEHWVLTQSMLCINPAALFSEGSNKQHTFALARWYSHLLAPSHAFDFDIWAIILSI